MATATANLPRGGEPAGPRFQLPGTVLWQITRDPLNYLSGLKARYGDLVRLQAGPVRIFLCSDPEVIREVLVTREKSFRKGRGLQVARRMVGNGLLTSEGDFHKEQRKLMQPVFHRQRVAGFGATMVEASQALSRQWQDGLRVDALEAMHRLALRIVGRTLFDSEMEHHARTVAEALEDGRQLMRWAMFPLLERLEKLLPPLRQRAARNRARIDDTLLPLIEEHRRRPHDDLLSMLIEAQMSDEQVRDEAVTLFLAGHETTANLLAWTLHLLAQHPAVQERLHAELQLVLQGRAATPDDRLPYTEQVLLETMRLYPPAWIVGRQALTRVTIGDFEIPQGSTVLSSQYLVHRDERWFPDPERFDPSRWERQPRSSLPRYAYFPFGGGSRVCIGEHFAMLEATLILATLLADWRVAPGGEGPPVMPQAGITLRPSPGPQVRLSRR